MYYLEAGFGCNMGRVRKNNEDNLYVFGMFLPEGNAGLRAVRGFGARLDQPVTVAVFDGMGGEAYGEVASMTAVRCMRSAILADPNTDLSRFCEDANLSICQERARRGVSSMGSTAVILRLTQSEAEIVNVGDSRAFLLRGGELRQLSVDHTDAAFLAELGVTDRKPRLTQNLGVDPEEMLIDPSAITVPFAAEDRFLLCSDGLTDMVSMEEIQTCLLEEPGVMEATEKLIALAMERGGVDNTTVICCRIREDG